MILKRIGYICLRNDFPEALVCIFFHFYLYFSFWLKNFHILKYLHRRNPIFSKHQGVVSLWVLYHSYKPIDCIFCFLFILCPHTIFHRHSVPLLLMSAFSLIISQLSGIWIDFLFIISFPFITLATRSNTMNILIQVVFLVWIPYVEYIHKVNISYMKI